MSKASCVRGLFVTFFLLCLASASWAGHKERPPKKGILLVAFGSTVTFNRDDGRVQTYRIVGEDEADPKVGSISYVSPVARLLMGKSVGDVVTVGGQELEIEKIV